MEKICDNCCNALCAQMVLPAREWYIKKCLDNRRCYFIAKKEEEVIDNNYCYEKCKKGKQKARELLDQSNSANEAALDFTWWTEECKKTCPKFQQKS